VANENASGFSHDPALAKSERTPPSMRILICLLILSFHSLAHARFAPRYSFEELMQRSDLVVIIEHESTRETEERDEAHGGTGRLTAAKVLTTLKGECNDARISIRHLHYEPTPNSPNAVEFPGSPGPITLKKGTMTFFVHPPWRYIAFLKQDRDGTYVPSVDAFDSALCFISLVESGVIDKLAGPPAEAESDRR
jgi:hypothetical protein